MEMLIDHLFEKGHQKIALATPYSVSGNNPRSTAYVNKMYPILGNKIDNYIFTCTEDTGNFRPEEEDFFHYGEILALQIIAKKNGITAVVCFNDDLAIGMIHQLQRSGVRVPQDISVGGIDGLRVGSYLYPKLTTVSISPFNQGKECARILLDMIDGKKVKKRTNLPLKIIEGESVRTL